VSASKKIQQFDFMLHISIGSCKLHKQALTKINHLAKIQLIEHLNVLNHFSENVINAKVRIAVASTMPTCMYLAMRSANIPGSELLTLLVCIADQHDSATAAKLQEEDTVELCAVYSNQVLQNRL
jgi:hypothetical protein